jgi:hypothetical protein
MAHPSFYWVKLTIHLHPMLMLKRERSYTSFPSYMSSWCAKGQFHLQMFTVVYLNKAVLFAN